MISIGIAILMALQGAPAIPLPTKTDVPEDMGGVVLCADDATARTMFDTYFIDKPGSTLIDLDAFFAGLKATGCTQGGGPLTLTRVDQRKKLTEGNYVRFAGLKPDGKPVYGILNEDLNNRFPRNDFERWLSAYQPDGIVRVSKTNIGPTYRCATPELAQAVVRAIPDPAAKGTTKSKAKSAFANALKANRCAKASGEYRITAVHNTQWINIGFEASEDWTALTAIDAAGRTIGLLYDGAQM